MNHEVKLREPVHSPDPSRFRAGIWFLLGFAAVVLMLRPTVMAAIGPYLTANTPDTIQLLGVTPDHGSDGRYTIRVRLLRKDGAPLSAGSVSAPRLVDPASRPKFVGRQNWFSMNRGPGYRWIDVTLTGQHPAGVNASRPVTAEVRVQVLSPLEALQLRMWDWSRRKLPAPKLAGSPWKTFSQEVILPAPTATSSTDPE